MKNHLKRFRMTLPSLLLIALLVAIGCTGTIDGFTQTNNVVGLISSSAGAFDGFTLFAPIQSTTTYLIDMDGQIVHTWPNDARPGQSVYLLEDGNLLRTGNANQTGRFDAGGQGGKVELISWDGTVTWRYQLPSNDQLPHHDVEMLPNGNVLLVVWELISEAEALAQGRDPSLIRQGELWPDKIVEVDPDTDEIVWQWRSWDHLVQDFDSGSPNFGVVGDHPELIDLNFDNGRGGADWLHVNSVAYNAEFDQIVISVHNFGEVWIIDHTTTTAEAASHAGGQYGRGGDLLYRWGNPQTYGAGEMADQQLYVQHNAQWIEEGLPGAGHLLVFNNGSDRVRPYSTVDELVLPVDGNGNYAFTAGQTFGPSAPTWRYEAPTPEDFFATNISGAQRLPNGNTLICDGPAGKFFEVTETGNTVWEYVNPVVNDRVLTNDQAQSSNRLQNLVFRATRYASEYAGLANLN